MRGVVYLGNRRVAVENFPDPEPKSNEVLIKMKAATICGSDMHVYRMDKENLRKHRPKKVIAGHEASGVVEKVGECVEDPKVGDRVSVFHLFGCGHCEMCRRGYPMYCTTPGAASALSGNVNGAMADYLVVPPWPCLKLPPELSFIDGAVLGCAGITAYQILTKLNVTASDTVAIYGLGPLGDCAVILAKAMGAKVIGIDVIEERIALAEKMGLDVSINAKENDPVKEIKELTKRKSGVDVAIDFTGNATATLNAVRSVRPLGKVGVMGVGVDMTRPVIIPGVFPSQGIWVTGARVSNINLYFDCVRFMIDHDISFEKVVTHKFPLEKAQEAFRLFDTLKTGKIAFIW